MSIISSTYLFKSGYQLKSRDKPTANFSSQKKKVPRFLSRHFDSSWLKNLVLLITLRMALHCSNVPARHDGVTVSRHVKHEDPAAESVKWNLAIICFIIDSCVFSLLCHVRTINNGSTVWFIVPKYFSLKCLWWQLCFSIQNARRWALECVAMVKIPLTGYSGFTDIFHHWVRHNLVLNGSYFQERRRNGWFDIFEIKLVWSTTHRSNTTLKSQINSHLTNPSWSTMLRRLCKYLLWRVKVYLPHTCTIWELVC